MEELKIEGTLRRRCQLRPVQYWNNILEQDHRAIKRRVRASQGFRFFWAVWRTIQGYEAVQAIRKGQARRVGVGEVGRRLDFIAGLFQIARWGAVPSPSCARLSKLQHCPPTSLGKGSEKSRFIPPRPSSRSLASHGDCDRLVRLTRERKIVKISIPSRGTGMRGNRSLSSRAI
jgi:DDE domain